MFAYIFMQIYTPELGQVLTHDHHICNKTETSCPLIKTVKQPSWK